MKNASQSNLFYSLLALLFSLLLFFNANSQGNNTNSNSTTKTYDEMLYNVPIHLEYDEDKYFVSGYEEIADVQLSSANRIQLNLESNEDTRNFQVVADLTQTSLGTSEVRLRAKGLSTAVTAEIEPQTITVTLEKKVTKSFDVEVQLPDLIENDGYVVDKTTVTPKTVQITTGEETLKAISRVIAPVSNTKQTFETITQTVGVQAVDAKGQVLSIENPAPQVKVNVELSPPTKEVPLQVTATGTPPDGISHYTFSLSETKSTIKGATQVLALIEKVDVPVDITGIRTSKKKIVRIPNKVDYEVSPTEVEVMIIPVYQQTSSSSIEVNSSNSKIVIPSQTSSMESIATSSTSEQENSSSSSKESESKKNSEN